LSGARSELKHPPSDLVGGAWRALPTTGGATIRATNPARPDSLVWQGVPVVDHIDDAIAAARAALPAWSRTPREKRFAVLRRYQSLVKQRTDEIAGLIADETGKVMWDARGEAQALAGKVDITLDESEHGALRRVAPMQHAMGETKDGRCWFRPHGVMAVVGPFNFPMHLANGHIVPALAMGNTIVLKPSDKAPACGQLLAELFDEALRAENAPPGVVNVVQGAAESAKRLVAHDGIDGILFTGSWPVGRAILQANLDRPGRIVALEMGGNNAAVVMDDADLLQAAVECVRCAFITSGQRCTCTRRIIVHEKIAKKFIAALCKGASNLIFGDPRAEHPVFAGPLISSAARDAVLGFQHALARAGGEVLVEGTAIDTPAGGWLVSPSVVRVNRFTSDEQDPAKHAGCDAEVFGPLARVCVVRDLDEAIEQANASRYGLAASIFTKNQPAIDRFLHEARAGCINANCGTAGASSKLPFGGLGLSGNHRPAGSFSLDYCAYPVAGMIERSSASTTSPGMRVEPEWLA
jgi:succinylglutamic semialdehyde dehydrogenase